jgi:putative endonuclease
MVEHAAVNRRVAGSSPARGALRLAPPNQLWGEFVLVGFARGSFGAATLTTWTRCGARDPDHRRSEERCSDCMNYGGGARRTVPSTPSEEPPMPAWMYVLRLRSGALYLGAARNLLARGKAHFGGTACRTTSLDPPVAPVHSEQFDTLGQARRCENQLKRWCRAQKEALIRSDLASLKAFAKRRQP